MKKIFILLSALLIVGITMVAFISLAGNSVSAKAKIEVPATSVTVKASLCDTVADLKRFQFILVTHYISNGFYVPDKHTIKSYAEAKRESNKRKKRK